MNKPTILPELYEAAGITEIEFLSKHAGLDDQELAEKQIKLLVKVMNGKDTVDMNDTNQTKYWPVHYIGEYGFVFTGVDFSFWSARSFGGPSFLFVREADAKFAGTVWIQLYKRLNRIKE